MNKNIKGSEVHSKDLNSDATLFTNLNIEMQNRMNTLIQEKDQFNSKVNNITKIEKNLQKRIEEKVDFIDEDASNENSINNYTNLFNFIDVSRTYSLSIYETMEVCIKNNIPPVLNLDTNTLSLAHTPFLTECLIKYSLSKEEENIWSKDERVIILSDIFKLKSFELFCSKNDIWIKKIAQFIYNFYCVSVHIDQPWNIRYHIGFHNDKKEFKSEIQQLSKNYPNSIWRPNLELFCFEVFRGNLDVTKDEWNKFIDDMLSVIESHKLYFGDRPWKDYFTIESKKK